MRPDSVRSDKAYSSRAIRTHLRDRGRLVGCDRDDKHATTYRAAVVLNAVIALTQY